MNLYKELSEEEIAQRVLKGEKSLYEIIVRRFNPTLYKIGRSYNYNHDDTQDLMQDTFIDAYRNLSGFEGRSSFKTWMIRIMLNNCYHKKRKLSFTNEVMEDTDENSQPMFTNAINDTNKLVQNRELGHIIEEALAKIPEEYRMVFSLREVNGLNVKETAELLNISESNVKVRLNRSKSLLRKEVEKSYTAAELFEFNAKYCNAMTDRVMNIVNNL
ncbi:MAG: sigma-70 family RNA polymerase sigma factor [Bacteroidia bacterium]|nr:sigma-70 family RNA polymerase sigma factor [Bacteroidia bacterium]